ncbi:MAG TPA: bifunctional riboflavin kinase/FAD synthetase [Usitatibacter sp.]|nr:bifunctional riboflavin kinase/FAD synthetase [Usitatibacter sp.]
MRIVRRHAAPSGTAIAVGSFDGVHLGHQAMLERVGDAAKRRALVPAALTFEPLPREYFAGRGAPPRLSSLAEKLALLSQSGIAEAFVERFDARFAAIPAPDFAERLAGHYGARWVIVGPDFRYGARRQGDVESLRAAGRNHGFEVEVLSPVVLDGARVSSTRVREALAAARFEEAARLLGRPYAVCGRVLHGAKRGRAMGYPTANVRLARPRAPLCGIFAVRCSTAATRGLEGVASLGSNPALGPGGPETLEAFLFDFSGDLYGERLSIEFVKKLREEAAFASLEALAAQIARDCDAARALFRAPRT